MQYEILQDYEDILLGNRVDFPKRYFQYSQTSNQNMALSVIKYAIETHLKWTPEQAKTGLTYEVIKAMKLDTLMHHIDFPCELSPKRDYFYVVHLIYPQRVPFNLTSQVLDVYKRVLDGKIRMPKAYCDGSVGSFRACICMQYVLSYCMPFHSVKEMYEHFGSMDGIRTLKKYNLFKVYREQFTYPLAYLHASLPDSQKNDFLFAYYSFRYFNKKQIRAMRKKREFVI